MSKKSEIIEKALILFAQNGYMATSISGLSKAVNLSPGAGGIYRHFASKQSILDAIFEQYFELTKNLTHDAMEIPALRGEARRQFLEIALQELYREQLKLKFYIRIFMSEVDHFSPYQINIKQEIRRASIRVFSENYRRLLDKQYHAHIDFETNSHLVFDLMLNRVANFTDVHNINDETYIKALSSLVYSTLVSAEVQH